MAFCPRPVKARSPLQPRHAEDAPAHAEALGVNDGNGGAGAVQAHGGGGLVEAAAERGVIKEAAEQADEGRVLDGVQVSFEAAAQLGRGRAAARVKSDKSAGKPRSSGGASMVT